MISFMTRNTPVFMIITAETRIKTLTHVISHLEIEIMREIGLKIGDFNARNILVAPLCKISVVALQEYFKFKFWRCFSHFFHFE